MICQHGAGFVHVDSVRLEPQPLSVPQSVKTANFLPQRPIDFFHGAASRCRLVRRVFLRTQIEGQILHQVVQDLTR